MVDEKQRHGSGRKADLLNRAVKTLIAEGVWGMVDMVAQVPWVAGEDSGASPGRSGAEKLEGRWNEGDQLLREALTATSVEEALGLASRACEVYGRDDRQDESADVQPDPVGRFVKVCGEGLQRRQIADALEDLDGILSDPDGFHGIDEMVSRLRGDR